MDFGNQPVDYSSLIGQGQNLAGNPIAQQQAGVNLQNSQIAGQQVQQQMAMQRYALQRQQSFGQDLGSYIKNPSASGLATLFGKYPEYEQQATAARGALDRGDITELGSAAALAAKGQYGEAAKVIQSRIDAETAAGTDPAKIAQSKHVLDLLNSDDPQQQKGALGLLSLGVGVAVGPEKAAEFLKANGLSSEPIDVAMDHRLVTASGQPIVGANPKLESVVTTNPDGSSTAHAFNAYTGKYGAAAVDGSDGTAPATQAGGGGPASGSGATAGGLQASVAHVLGNEGGYNPSDMNGSPTNFGINFAANKAVLAKMGINASNFKNMTQDQASQIYASKYWPKSGAEKLPTNLQAPYFDVYVRSPALAKRALAQSGGDPAKFAEITNAAFQKMAANNPKAAPYTHAWATRDAGNAAIATGQAPNAVPAAGGGQAAQSNPYEVGGSPTGAANTKGAPTNYQWTPDHTGVVPLKGSEADPSSYAPSEIYDIAWNHLVTGKWGSGGGMGGGNVPAPIQKVAAAQEAQIMKERGINPNQLAGIRAKTAGLTSYLNQATQMAGNLGAARENLASDGQLVVAKQKPLVQMGIIHDMGHAGGLSSNSWENNTRLDWYETHGTPEQQQAVKNYKDAVSTYGATYAKALSSANAVGGNTPSSDSARAQANELNDFGMGPTALRGHLATNLAEMDNKRGSWQKQAELAQRQLDNVIGPKGTPQQPSAKAVHVGSLQEAQSLPAGTLFVAPNGNTYRKR